MGRCLVLLLLLWTAAFAARAAEEPRLNVYNWNDYIAADTVAAFQRATGIAVRYDVYDSNAVLQSKLLTGASGYDVVYPSVEYAARQIQAGIYRPLDKSLLPNLLHLAPLILRAVEAADPGNRFVVPYMWYSTGVAIDAERVARALGGRLPDDSWDLLFDPATTARLKDCGIALMDEASDVIPAAMLHAGADPTRIDETTVRAALEHLLPVRRNVRTFNTAPIDLMAKGSLCVAMMFSGDALIAARRAAASHTGVRLQFLIPKRGAMMSIDVMAVPRDAPHPMNAHRWIDAMLEPATVARISDETYYISANRSAWALMSPALRDNPAANVTDEVRRTLRAKPVLDAAAQRALTQAMARFKAAR